MSFRKQLFAADVIGIEGTGTTGPIGITGGVANGPIGPTGPTGSESGGVTPNIGFYDSQDTSSFTSGDVNIPWSAAIEDSSYTLEGSPFELIEVGVTGLYRITYSICVENTSGTFGNPANISIICGVEDTGTIEDTINGEVSIFLGGGRKGVAALTFVANLTALDDIGIRCTAGGPGTAALAGDDHVLTIEFLR